MCQLIILYFNRARPSCYSEVPKTQECRGTNFDVTGFSDIRSRCVVTSLPRIKRFGVHPVVLCSADLYGIMQLSNSTSQLVWCSFSLDDNMVASVLFKRSTLPSDFASYQIIIYFQFCCLLNLSISIVNCVVYLKELYLCSLCCLFNLIIIGFNYVV